jgi:deoxycytidylate deaminase
MTNLLETYLHSLKTEAMKSSIQIKLAASLLKGKKMICKPCCNIERNYYKGIHYGSLHAEANAIFSYYGKNIAFNKKKNKWCITGHCQKNKLNLIVIRINKINELGLSRPCYHCLQILQDVGINKVYYTTGEIKNQFVCENVKDMISIQSSYSTIIYDMFLFSVPIEKKDLYFEELLKKKFPKYIKYRNLMYFIEYNFSTPNFHFTYNIKNEKIVFYNNKMTIITEANII